MRQLLIVMVFGALSVTSGCSNNGGTSTEKTYPDTAQGVAEAMNDTANRVIKEEKAKRRMQQVENDPVYALMASAQEHALQGNFATALNEYNKVINVNPTISEAYMGRGYIYHETKNYDKALDDYDKALNIDPENTQAYVNRAAVYAAYGNVQRSVADLQRACSLGDKNACRMLQRVLSN